MHDIYSNIPYYLTHTKDTKSNIFVKRELTNERKFGGINGLHRIVNRVNC